MNINEVRQSLNEYQEYVQDMMARYRHAMEDVSTVLDNMGLKYDFEFITFNEDTLTVTIESSDYKSILLKMKDMRPRVKVYRVEPREHCQLYLEYNNKWDEEPIWEEPFVPDYKAINKLFESIKR